MQLAQLQAWGDAVLGGLQATLARRPVILGLVTHVKAVFDKDAAAILALLPPNADTNDPGPIIDVIFSYIEKSSPWWAIVPEEMVESLLDAYFTAPPVVPPAGQVAVRK